MRSRLLAVLVLCLAWFACFGWRAEAGRGAPLEPSAFLSVQKPPNVRGAYPSGQSSEQAWVEAGAPASCEGGLRQAPIDLGEGSSQPRAVPLRLHTRSLDAPSSVIGEFVPTQQSVEVFVGMQGATEAGMSFLATGWTPGAGAREDLKDQAKRRAAWQTIRQRYFYAHGKLPDGPLPEQSLHSLRALDSKSDLPPQQALLAQQRRFAYQFEYRGLLFGLVALNVKTPALHSFGGRKPPASLLLSFDYMGPTNADAAQIASLMYKYHLLHMREKVRQVGGESAGLEQPSLLQHAMHDHPSSSPSQSEEAGVLEDAGTQHDDKKWTSFDQLPPAVAGFVEDFLGTSAASRDAVLRALHMPSGSEQRVYRVDGLDTGVFGDAASATAIPEAVPSFRVYMELPIEAASDAPAPEKTGWADFLRYFAEAGHQKTTHTTVPVGVAPAGVGGKMVAMELAADLRDADQTKEGGDAGRWSISRPQPWEIGLHHRLLNIGGLVQRPQWGGAGTATSDHADGPDAGIRHYYTYMGSDVWPDCRELAMWFVAQPVSMSPGNLKRTSPHHAHDSARPGNATKQWQRMVNIVRRQFAVGGGGGGGQGAGRGGVGERSQCQQCAELHKTAERVSRLRHYAVQERAHNQVVEAGLVAQVKELEGVLTASSDPAVRADQQAGSDKPDGSASLVETGGVFRWLQHKMQQMLGSHPPQSEDTPPARHGQLGQRMPLLVRPEVVTALQHLTGSVGFGNRPTQPRTDRWVGGEARPPAHNAVSAGLSHAFYRRYDPLGSADAANAHAQPDATARVIRELRRDLGATLMQSVSQVEGRIESFRAGYGEFVAGEQKQQQAFRQALLHAKIEEAETRKVRMEKLKSQIVQNMVEKERIKQQIQQLSSSTHDMQAQVKAIASAAQDALKTHRADQRDGHTDGSRDPLEVLQKDHAEKDSATHKHGSGSKSDAAAKESDASKHVTGQGDTKQHQSKDKSGRKASEEKSEEKSDSYAISAATEEQVGAAEERKAIEAAQGGDAGKQEAHASGGEGSTSHSSGEKKDSASAAGKEKGAGAKAGGADKGGDSAKTEAKGARDADGSTSHRSQEKKDEARQSGRASAQTEQEQAADVLSADQDEAAAEAEARQALTHDFTQHLSSDSGLTASPLASSSGGQDDTVGQRLRDLQDGLEAAGAEARMAREQRRQKNRARGDTLAQQKRQGLLGVREVDPAGRLAGLPARTIPAKELVGSDDAGLSDALEQLDAVIGGDGDGEDIAQKLASKVVIND